MEKKEEEEKKSAGIFWSCGSQHRTVGALLEPLGLFDHDQCIMMHLFIYFPLFFFFGVPFLPFSSGGRLVGGAGASCSAVLAYMCYSCSNIVVVSIHIHALESRAVCMEV